MAKGWWRRFVIATRSTGFSLRSSILLSGVSCQSRWTTSWTHLANFFMTHSYCWRNASVTLVMFWNLSVCRKLKWPRRRRKSWATTNLGLASPPVRSNNISAVFHLLVAQHKPLEPLPLGDYYLVVILNQKGRGTRAALRNQAIPLFSSKKV